MDPGHAAAKAMNTYIKQGKEEAQKGLKFVWIGAASTPLVVFADTSFATYADTTSELGLLIRLQTSLATRICYTIRV